MTTREAIMIGGGLGLAAYGLLERSNPFVAALAGGSVAYTVLCFARPVRDDLDSLISRFDRSEEFLDAWPESQTLY